MEEKLRELLQNLDLIVIGYHGADYSIMNVLQQVKTPNCELIWCALDETKVHWRVANLINNTPNSWFIKIKGFDDIIKDFYLELVKSPPDLLEKAKIRQEEISHYISEYNKELQNKAETIDEKESLKKQQAIWELYITALNEKDPEKVVDIANQILHLDKENSSGFFLKGRAYYLLKNYEKSVNEYTEAIKLNKLNEELWAHYNNRGLSYRFLGKYENAIIDYTKAIELNKDQGSIYSNRGATYIPIKDYKNAIKDLTKSIELDKEFPNSHKHLGEVYYKLKQFDKALSELNIAIELNSKYIDAYELRALVYKALGQTNEAKKDEAAVKKLNEVK